MNFIPLEKLIKHSQHIVSCDFMKVWFLILYLVVGAKLTPPTSAGSSRKQLKSTCSKTEVLKNEKSFALMNLSQNFAVSEIQTSATLILASVKILFLGTN